MALHYATEGIILKKRDEGEAHRIFTVFTKEFGKLELWAISERKIASKLRGGLEVFYLSDIEFIQGKRRRVATDATAREQHAFLRADIQKLRCAHVVAKAISFFIKGQEKDEKVWQLLCTLLAYMNNPVSTFVSCKFAYYYFLWNLASAAGYLPNAAMLAHASQETKDMIVWMLQDDLPSFLARSAGQESKGLAEISKHYLSTI